MNPVLRTGTALLGIVVVIAGCGQPNQPATPPGAGSPSAPSSTASSAGATPSPAGPQAAVTPVLAEPVAAPIPVPATDGKDRLAYELRLTNTLGQEVTLTSLTVRAGDRSLLTLAGDQLAYWTRALGNPAPTNKLGPGQSGVVWLDVALDRPADGAPGALPGQLQHSVVVHLAQPQPPLLPETITEDVAPVTVNGRKPPVISPPLTGPNWLDGNSCCDMTPHRTALNPLNGQLWGAERFAVDYVQLGPDGRLFTGDRAKLESYPYFGADIHAVGDGPVVSVVDGLPEQVPGKSPTGLPLDQYGGNHIVQDLGDGDYAFYAHLKTGSITVKPGDRLTTGQVIAALGNSGNTDAPHLHFHVMGAADPLRADGLPFLLSAFTLDSRLASIDALDPLMAGKPAALQPGFAQRSEKDVSPLVLDVMSYGDR